MWEIANSKPNQIDLSLSGSLDAVEMSLLLDEFLAASKDMEHGKMLYSVTKFEMPTISALAVEIKYLPRLFSLLSRIDKVALCCDADWIKTAAKIESAILPGITVETFGPDDKTEAQAWLDGS